MRKRLYSILLLVVIGVWNYLNAQTADGGIFGSGSTLTVKFKSNGGDITGAFTGGNFAIRWLSSLGTGINLSGETGSFGYINQGPKATSGVYDYIVYASGSLVLSTTYTNGVEYILMTVTVIGGVGTGSFELCPSDFAGGDGQWYIELGGANKANANPALWYYQSATLSVEVATGWNLVSVPLLQSDYSANVVFPGKFGEMFGYNTSVRNYETAENLACGAGYWVNYQTAGSVIISGMVPETVSVEATQNGWVMIGSRHIPVQVSSLVLSDDAVINGAAYRYNTATGAYESTSVLTPGDAHWLNVNKACTVTFP